MFHPMIFIVFNFPYASLVDQQGDRNLSLIKLKCRPRRKRHHFPHPWTTARFSFQS